MFASFIGWLTSLKAILPEVEKMILLQARSLQEGVIH
jgi:hypothetical protein